MSEADQRDLQRVLVAARQAALAATRDRQVAEDAVTHTLEAWETKQLSRKAIGNPEAWARRTAANAVKSLALRNRRSHTPIENISETLLRHQPERTSDNEGRVPPPEQLRNLSSALTPRQIEVLEALICDRLSLHRAAKRLGTDRANIRRIFSRALRNLRARRPPPPSSP